MRWHARRVKLRNTLQVCWIRQANWRPMASMFDSFVLAKPLMNFSTVLFLLPFHRNPALCAVPTVRASRSSLQACAIRLAVNTAALLLALNVQAQIADAPAAATADAAAAEMSAPRYSASDLERAFGFMDGNRDGKVSREEASGFRGVAKNFDRADTNQDGFLSREEFDAAMNYVKPK